MTTEREFEKWSGFSKEYYDKMEEMAKTPSMWICKKCESGPCYLRLKNEFMVPSRCPDRKREPKWSRYEEFLLLTQPEEVRL